MRMTGRKSPAGAGSQFDSLSGADDSYRFENRFRYLIATVSYRLARVRSGLFMPLFDGTLRRARRT
jgi:hypothetical protein